VELSLHENSILQRNSKCHQFTHVSHVDGDVL